MFAFFKRLKDRLKKLMDDYGGVALAIYWAIFLSSIAGFYLAIGQGIDLQALFVRVGLDWGEGAQTTGTIAVAYAATKLLQPLRILMTLSLVPPVGNWWNKRKAEKVREANPSSPTSTTQDKQD